MYKPITNALQSNSNTIILFNFIGLIRQFKRVFKDIHVSSKKERRK
jgi:hypothetical protein